MFSTDQREALRDRLLDRAGGDPRISGAAITGSAAAGAEDRWSDIDLFLGVADGCATREVMEEWSAFIYEDLRALHHFDLEAPPAIYRAWLLPGCLEVDLGFTPAASFGPLGPHFRSVFGVTVDRRDVATGTPAHIIGLAWHHVLHARACIERHRVWQAEYWISAVRDHTLALACLRFGEVAAYAKGADLLPPEVTSGLEDSLVRSLSIDELRRALSAATLGLRRELAETDAELAGQLEDALVELAEVRPVR
ncbi:MAG: hypothetical protein ACLQK4_15165 [Acidimicrobiales bacterium]